MAPRGRNKFGPLFSVVPEFAQDERGTYLIYSDSDGRQLKVDLVDRHFVDACPWRAMEARSASCVYAVSPKLRLLHRLIMQTPPRLTVDHGDTDGLNDRRHNLSNITVAQNVARRHHFPRTASGRTGVYPVGSRYMATISIGNKAQYIGTYDTIDEAARAWDKVAFQVRGDFAVLNFPDE